MRVARDDAMTRDAQARFDEGKERVKAGDFEGARIKFTQAYSVLHSADILWNLALAEEKSGHLLEALSHFKQVVREAKSADDRANAKKHVDELMTKTAHVEVLAPAGTSVAMDGAAIAGVAPFAVVDCAPGHHVLEAKLAQGVMTIPVDAILGQTAHVSFANAEGAPAPAPATAVAAPGDAAAPVAPALAGAERPAAGGPGFWTTRRTVGVVVAGVGALSLGAGALFASFARDDASRAATLSASLGPSGCYGGNASVDCQSRQAAQDSQGRDHTLNLVFVGVGAAALATGGVLVLWPTSTQSGVSLQPVVGPNVGGLQLRGDI